MAAPRYPGTISHSGWRGLTIVEIALAMSVIAGLMFVTVRVQSMGSSEPKDATVMMRTDVSALDPEATTTRTP